jgi:Kef-type K+ transport system membrane component KefB
MKKFKNVIFYIALNSVFFAIIYYILEQGKPLAKSKPVNELGSVKETIGNFDLWDVLRETLLHNISHPLSILLLQIITIIVVSRTFGYLMRKIGQPTVIGEVVAGIVLGPSVVGMLFPEYIDFLFPKASLPNLQFLSQIGLLLFMFVIGMELDIKVLKAKAHDAVVISHASIIVPYTLGMGLAYYLYVEFAPENISFTSFSLFMGIAMSITAFPVLARIIRERKLGKTKLGIIAITCAAADDITAWCLLAAVIAIVKAGDATGALFTLTLSIGYVVFMFYVIQPALKYWSTRYVSGNKLTLNSVAMLFGIMLISSYVTEVIGIHALFGAFMAGIIMPASLSFRKVVTEKVEHVSMALLLPLFFAFSGLRTQIGLLNDARSWGICGLIVLVAIIGKFGGSFVAAKITGQNWKDSLSIGVLMNTRGLVELIVLNIGYDLGILNPEIFAMLVIMALVTTFMTGPLLDLINWAFRDQPEEEQILEIGLAE